MSSDKLSPAQKLQGLFQKENSVSLTIQTSHYLSFQYECLASFAKKALLLMEMPFDPLLSIFTQSMSDMLCLETLKHGTSFRNYFHIRLAGADPRHGGEIGGSSAVINAHYLNACKTFFYVFKDTLNFSLGAAVVADKKIEDITIEDRKAAQRELEELPMHFSLLRSYVLVPMLTRMHAVLSGWSCYENKVIKILSSTASFFTPTINFRFTPEELDLSRYHNKKVTSNKELAAYKGRFLEDEDYSGMAWKTKAKIGAEHIGFYGILSQGLKGDLMGRIKKNPQKCLSGCIRLIGLSLLGTVAIARLYIAWENHQK